MIIYIYIFILLIRLTSEENLLSDVDCIHGIIDTKSNSSIYQCHRGWIYSLDTPNIYVYQQKSKLAAFLLSFFVGALGADWFYLSVGNGGYIAAGRFKILTLGGIGIWWLVDWIRLLTNSFPDGQGIDLLEWSP